MYVKTRQLSAKEVQELDQLAQKQGLSREKLVTSILRQFLANRLNMKEYERFFEEELEKVIQVLEKNDETFQKVSKQMEEREANRWK